MEIVENWDKLEKIPLNKVAATIKSDELFISRGEYDKTSNGDWRNFRWITDNWNIKGFGLQFKTY